VLTPFGTDRRKIFRQSVLLVAVFLLMAMIAVPWDLEISQLVRKTKIPGDLRRFIYLMEIFAHTLGCILILGTLLWIDEKNRRKIWNASLFVLACGILANLAKYIIPRSRPSVFDLEPWSHLNPDRDPTEPFLSSWDVWGVPFTKSWFDESIRSFPSGHTATAVAMAIGLTYVYPKGKPLFLLMATLAALQRLVVGAHYLSDIFVSVALALLVAFAWGTLPDASDDATTATHPNPSP
jgi:membrane-associated phospholipid phosphatase